MTPHWSKWQSIFIHAITIWKQDEIFVYFWLFSSISDRNIPLILVCSVDILIKNYASFIFVIHFILTDISKLILIGTVCYRGFFLATSRVNWEGALWMAFNMMTNHVCINWRWAELKALSCSAILTKVQQHMTQKC